MPPLPNLDGTWLALAAVGGLGAIGLARQRTGSPARLGRLVKQVSAVRIYWNTEWGEYVVVPPGVGAEGAYYTDDRDDAIATAQAMVKTGRGAMNKSALSPAQRDLLNHLESVAISVTMGLPRKFRLIPPGIHPNTAKALARRGLAEIRPTDPRVVRPSETLVDQVRESIARGD